MACTTWDDQTEGCQGNRRENTPAPLAFDWTLLGGGPGSFSFPAVPPGAALQYDVELLQWEAVDDERPKVDMLYEERLEAGKSRIAFFMTLSPHICSPAVRWHQPTVCGPL